MRMLESSVWMMSAALSIAAEPVGTTYVDWGPPAADIAAATQLTTVRVAMTIQNTDSAPLRVITGGKIYLGKWGTRNGSNYCELEFTRIPWFTPKGETIMFSESELKVVTLLKNECAQLDGEVKIPIPIDVKNITAKYSIDPWFAGRFNVWTGQIEMQVINVRERPNKSPEPTPGSVTPRASDPKSK